MNILVTGGAGFIGSHACKALASHGFTPIAYDNLSRGNKWSVKWGPLEIGEIQNAMQMREALKKYRPVALMHFAAFAYVAESVKDPIKYYENNVASTTSLLQSLIEFKVVPVVFSSSCATYGTPTQLPITEDHLQRPINPYGHSKLFAEQILRDLQVSHDLKSIALRYFNAAGADPDCEIGEAHDPESHLIPLAIGAASTGSVFRINGTDYNTPDGTCIRDFVHVADIAEAHVLALKYLLRGGERCELNLSNEVGYSVKEVVAVTETVVGHPIRLDLAPRRPGDPPVLIGDSTRARERLGWKPSRSNLSTQICDAWNWTRKHHGECELSPRVGLPRDAAPLRH